MRTILKRLLALFTRRRLDRDLDDEIRAHIDLLAAEYERGGMSPADARLAARRAFGGAEQMKETYRDRRGIPLLETMARDARYAVRALARDRGFAVVAILSLALGIGATTAVFNVMNAVMLRPLAGSDVSRIVVLEPRRNNERYILFNPEFEAIRARQHSLSGMVAISERPFQRVEFPSGPSSYIAASLVSGSYFEVLGVMPALGRLLTAADDDGTAETADGACAAVISDAFWSRQYQRRPDAIGSVLRLRERDCAIVGVAPPRFVGHSAGRVPDVWFPLRPLTERRLLEHQTLAFYSGVMGRLNPGVSRELATRDLTALYRDVQALEPPIPATQRQPPKPSELSLVAADGSTGLGGLRRQFGEPLWIVLGAVALTLLVAAINVANLLLSRGVARGPELATRMALGASRGRVTAQLVTEGAVIAVAGGMLGVLLSTAATPALASVISYQANGVVLDVSLERRVLLIASAATMLTALVIGLIPAVRATSLRASRSLVIGDRSRSDVGGQRVMRGLLVVQFAISLLLVTAAGLLLRTSIGLSGIALGFEQEHVVTLEINDEAPGGSVSVNVPEDDETRMKRAVTYQQLEDRLNAVTDVRSASLAWYGLFSTNDLWTTVIDPLRPEDRREAHLNFVSARYFETVGMQVVRGRAFTLSDGYDAPQVAVVNETFVRERLGGRDPIGVQLTPAYPGRPAAPATIVGVVADSRYNNLRETKTGPMFWAPLQQKPYRINSVNLRVTPGAEAVVTRRAEDALRAVSPYLMVRQRTTLAEQVGRTAGRERLLLNLSVGFGIFALVLAAIGLHGTLAYSVSRRRREIGVRLALGAQRSTVVRQFLREAMVLAAASAVIGVPMALGAGRWLRAFLYGVAPQDPTTVLTSCAVLVLTVLVASSMPAFGASRVDPATALRSE
jgi:predicted permease